MKHSVLFTLMVASVMLALSSCTKEPLNNLSGEEGQVYITNHDSSTNFGNYKTFSIVDTVSVIDNHRVSSRERTQWDQDLITALSSQMKARGFQEVQRTDDPDLGINISRLYNTYTGVVSYPDYWGNYYDYYDPYYWGYDGYSYYFPPSYGIYQVTEGAVSIDILDLKNASGTNSIEGVWNGLVKGSATFNNSGSNIAQALFEQSPYLKTAN